MTLTKICVAQLLALTLFTDVSNANQAIWLTSIQPFTGGEWDGGISMRFGAQIMLEEVNANPSLLPGYELKVAWQDGMCNKGVGTQLFLENLFDKKYTIFAPGKNVSELDADGDGTVTTADVAPMTEIWNSTRVTPNPVGLLGSGCAGTALNVANIAYMARFPMVSNSATRPGLSDRSLYPNFFRTIMPDTFFNDAWIRMARELNQTEVGIVIGETENWGSMGGTLANAALAQGVRLIGNDLTQDISNFYGMKVALDSQAMAASAAMDLVKYKPRVTILLMFHKRNRLVLCEAFKVNVFNVIYMPMGWLPFGWWGIHDTTCNPADLTSMAVGFVSANMMFWRADGNTRLSCSSSMTATGFQDEWFRRQGGTHGDLSMRPEGYALATEAATTADAVCMYAQMLHKVLIDRGVPLSDLTDRTVNGYNNVFDVLSNTNFEGVQGTVKFNPGEADPLGSVILQQLQYDSTGSLTLLDVASYKHPVITYIGLGYLKFQFAGERFFAGPNGATSLGANLVSFRICVNQVLNMRTNLCEDCPVNTQYVQRSQACLCVAGFYQGPNGGCLECPAGTISTAPGTISCASCTVGKYSRSGSTTCTFCPRGRFSNSIGLGECHACPPYLTTADIASESIAACICDTNAYKNSNSSTGCTPCPVSADTGGLNQVGLASCQCPIDTYMDNAICEACPGGSSTRGLMGRLSVFDCKCRRDTYMDGRFCRTCPDGSTTRSHGKIKVESCLCANRTYMPKDARACLECPKGMVCGEGSSENNARYITLANKNEEQIFMHIDDGFWASVAAPMDVFMCRSKEKCKRGLPGQNCAPLLRNEQACEHCSAGYHWNGQQCEACSSFEMVPFLYPVLPLLIAPGIICLMYKFFGDDYTKWSSKRNGLFSLLFILLNFYQTVDITSTFNIPLPKISMTMFTIWAWTNGIGAIFKLDCLGLAEYDGSIVLRGLVPPIIAGYCILIVGVLWVLGRRNESLKPDLGRMFNVFGSIMFTFYNTISSFCLLLFQCANNPSGHQTLAVDLGVICGASSDAWNSMVAPAVIFLLLYIVFMTGVFARAIIIAPKNFEDVPFQLRWKFLFIKFRADAYWWGIVFMLKNFLVNLSFVISAEGIVQLYLTMAWTTFYMCMVVLITPFRHRVANALDMVGSLCILYVSALLTWFAERADTDSVFNSVDVTTGIISILPAIVAAGCLCHLARYGKNAPPTQRDVIQAEKEFQEVVAVFQDLCQLNIEEGAMVLLEIGEWDRRYLKHAITAIQTEALGHHTSLRIANKTLSERVLTRVNSVKVIRSASEYDKDKPATQQADPAAQVFVTV